MPHEEGGRRGTAAASPLLEGGVAPDAPFHHLVFLLAVPATAERGADATWRQPSSRAEAVKVSCLPA